MRCQQFSLHAHQLCIHRLRLGCAAPTNVLLALPHPFELLLGPLGPIPELGFPLSPPSGPPPRRLSAPLLSLLHEHQYIALLGLILHHELLHGPLELPDCFIELVLLHLGGVNELGVFLHKAVYCLIVGGGGFLRPIRPPPLRSPYAALPRAI